MNTCGPCPQKSYAPDWSGSNSHTGRWADIRWNLNSSANVMSSLWPWCPYKWVNITSYGNKAKESISLECLSCGKNQKVRYLSTFPVFQHCLDSLPSPPYSLPVDQELKTKLTVSLGKSHSAQILLYSPCIRTHQLSGECWDGPQTSPSSRK